MNCKTCSRHCTVFDGTHCKTCKGDYCPLHNEHPHKPHIFTIEGYYTYIDWAEFKPYQVDESKIWGFELYWRGGNDWFVKVVPREGEKYYIGKGTHRRGISELLAHPNAIILGIFNDKNLEGFMPELLRVMPDAKALKQSAVE